MVFQRYSLYYDLLYKDKNYREEIRYVTALIERYSPRKSRSIADFGCGTGIHARYLSDLGYVVHGVDRSEDMIRIAHKKGDENLVFSTGDITSINLEKKFDVVVSLFHVFSYITKNQDIDHLLENVSRHLESKGLFIFDCWYGPAVLTERPEDRIKKLEDDEIVVNRYAKPVMYPNDDVIDVNYDIIIKEKKRDLTERISEIHTMRYFFKPELEHFLNSHGFSLIHCEEWMTGRLPGCDTWGVCWVAQKNK